VSRRQSVVAGRDLRPAGAGPPKPTRAEGLVASGLLDVAGGIGDLAHSLTDSVMQVIETRISERGRGAAGAAADVDFLREAVFTGIAQNIIIRAEITLGDESEKADLSRPVNRNEQRSRTK
jgi:hypothetical protein